MISNSKKIAIHYLKGWFVIDAIAAVPFDLLFFGSGTSDVSMNFNPFNPDHEYIGSFTMLFIRISYKGFKGLNLVSLNLKNSSYSLI